MYTCKSNPVDIEPMLFKCWASVAGGDPTWDDAGSMSRVCWEDAHDVWSTSHNIPALLSKLHRTVYQLPHFYGTSKWTSPATFILLGTFSFVDAYFSWLCYRHIPFLSAYIYLFLCKLRFPLLKWL